MHHDKKTLVVDLDDTLTIDESSIDYEEKQPNLPVIRRLRDFKGLGFKITINTARNMKSFNGNIGKINVVTLPIIINWLDKHDVPYDEIIVGKPYCGADGFYIDDKAIRPDEFARLDVNALYELTNRKNVR